MGPNSSSEGPREANRWKWTRAAGVAPLIVGALLLGATWWSFFHKADGRSLGVSRLDFSDQAIRAVSPSAASYLETLGSVGAVNIVAGAVAVIVVSRNSLRHGQS